jgi:phosphatidylinositol alpha-1,6-mannosyltransferase
MAIVPLTSTCLLVTNIFAPIHGGSANVYASLCRFSPRGSMVVLAAKRNYDRNELIDGWEEHDRHCDYPVRRLDLLRSPVLPPPANKLVSVYRRLAIDLPIAWPVLRTTLALIKQHRVGILCIGELNSIGWLGELARTLTGVRLVYYVHGEEVTTRLSSGSFGRKRLHHLRRADAVVAVSNFTRQTLITLGIPADRIHLLQNAVDTSRFAPGPADRAFLDRWGISHKRVIVSIGRLIARKGFDRSIEAWPAVLERHPDAHLLIVGNGPQRGALEKLISHHRVQHAVTLTGPVPDDDVLAAYRSGEFFMMPNRTLPDGDTEGFGLVFLEANACGRAVIGGRAGGVVEAVLDGQTGLLVDGTNATDIAAAVVRLLGDNALRECLQENGLQHARANTWTARALHFNELCQNLAG